MMTLPIVEAKASSTFTVVMQYMTLVGIISLFINQVPLFVGLIIEMGYEWVIAVFISFSFLLFPSLNGLFLFSSNLQSQLLTSDNVWSLWFLQIFQVFGLMIFIELMTGEFISHF